MRIFKLLFNSFFGGLVVSVLAFQSEWLEMRMNIGYFIPITMILTLAAYVVLEKKYKRAGNLSLIATLSNIAAGSAICIVVLGLERFKVVPAAIVRELLFLTKVSFHTMNIGLITLLGIGLIIIFLADLKNRRGYR